jgi:hypothetical protein
MEPDELSTAQTSRLLRRSPRRVLDFAREGRLPFRWTVVAGRPTRAYKLADVLRFEREGLQPPGRPRKDQTTKEKEAGKK